MTTDSSAPHSEPPTGEVDPRVPLTHVMLARDDTAPLLARALLRAWLGSRAYLVQCGLIVVAAVVLAVGFHQRLTALLLAGMLVLMPGLLVLRSRSVARALAPAGSTLGLGLGETHLAVRHAVTTVVSPYAAWASVTERRGVVRLVTRTGATLVVPAELMGGDLERLRTRIASPPVEPVAQPAPTTGAPAEHELPLAYVCTTKTRWQLTRAALLVRLRRWPTLLVLSACLVMAGLVVLFPRATSWTTATLMLLVAVLLIAAHAGVVWRSLGPNVRAGQVIRAELRADALVVQDATATASIPFQSVDRVVVTRHAVLVRSPVAGPLVLPRPLLPQADLSRMTGAVEYYRARR